MLERDSELWNKRCSRKLLLGMYPFLPMAKYHPTVWAILCLLAPKRDGFMVTRKELAFFLSHYLTSWDEST